MTPVTCFSGLPVAIFGLGGSGVSAALALQAGGALVHAWDDSEPARGKAAAQGVKLFDLHQADWAGFAALVLAPGLPLTHPEPHWSAAAALAAGIPVIGDIELFCRERAAIAPGAPLVAITGTNGKSTTTALIAHILREAGYDVQIGGNFGTPILDLEPPASDRIHVIECSSFQIDLAPSLAPSVGVMLNLTPDHLDRHGSMENYAAVKQRLVEAADYAIIGRDDDWCEAIFQYLKRSGVLAVGVSGARPHALATICYEGGRLRRAFALPGLKTLEENLFELSRAPALRGAHNGQNAAAAFAACERLGLAHDEIGLGLRSFPGLAHRMEQVGRRDHVLFVNDSKATNADATEKALLSFEHIFWILGGKPKAGGIDSLKPLFGRIDKAFLIGAASEDFARTLGDVPHEFCGTLDVAVARAAEAAAASGAEEAVVLLSPACASYDQFANFEQRGDAFRQLVAPLTEQDAVPAAEAEIDRDALLADFEATIQLAVEKAVQQPMDDAPANNPV